MAKKASKKTRGKAGGVRKPSKRMVHEPTKRAPKKPVGKPGAKAGGKVSAKKVESAGTTAVPAATPLRDHAIGEAIFAHDIVVKLCGDFTSDQALYQPTPTDNHLIWQLGHLAHSYSWFRSMLDGVMTPVPENYQKLFGMGSKPQGVASEYPTLDEVRSQFEHTWNALIATARLLSESDLMQPPAADSGGMAKTKAEMLLHLAWHDGWHAGQISSLRRAAGLKGIWG
jgi:uncharacterized damage-inducible protein DinB